MGSVHVMDTMEAKWESGQDLYMCLKHDIQLRVGKGDKIRVVKADVGMYNETQRKGSNGSMCKAPCSIPAQGGTCM